MQTLGTEKGMEAFTEKGIFNTSTDDEIPQSMKPLRMCILCHMHTYPIHYNKMPKRVGSIHVKTLAPSFLTFPSLSFFTSKMGVTMPAYQSGRMDV